MLKYKIPLLLWGAEPSTPTSGCFVTELLGLPWNKRRQTLQKGHLNVCLKSDWYFHTASPYHRAAVVQSLYTDTQKFRSEFEGWPVTGMELVLCGGRAAGGAIVSLHLDAIESSCCQHLAPVTRWFELELQSAAMMLVSASSGCRGISP